MNRLQALMAANQPVVDDVPNGSAAHVQVPEAQPTALNDIYRRIARFKVQGMGEEQIAEIYQLSTVQLDTLTQSPEFQVILHQVAAEQARQKLDTDDRWNGLEDKALKRIDAYLEHTNDPQFALRAAVAANRANRRFENNGKARPESLDVDGARVVIKISHYLADSLQVDHRGAQSKMLEAKRVTGNKEEVTKEREQGNVTFIEQESAKFDVKTDAHQPMYADLNPEDIDFETFTRR